jgi:hypothetical protein
MDQFILDFDQSRPADARSANRAITFKSCGSDRIAAGKVYPVYRLHKNPALSRKMAIIAG